MLSSLCRAALALRMRVSMSAIGSVTFIVVFVRLLGGGSLPALSGWRLPLMAAVVVTAMDVVVSPTSSTW